MWDPLRPKYEKKKKTAKKKKKEKMSFLKGLTGAH